MSDRKKYKTIENWKNQHYDQLKQDYSDCDQARKSMYENTTFDDYCVGVWQSLD